MKMRDAAEVTLSVMGVFRIAYAVLGAPSLAYALYMYFADEQRRMAFGGMKPMLVRNFGEVAANLVVGILLVLLAGRIADWLARRCVSAGAADLELRIVSPEGFRFCLKLVGISVLVTGVATLVEWDWAHVIAGALTLALGIYLIRGGGWLTRFAWGKAQA
jgi:hypothetical protein